MVRAYGPFHHWNLNQKSNANIYLSHIILNYDEYFNV